MGVSTVGELPPRTSPAPPADRPHLLTWIFRLGSREPTVYCEVSAGSAESGSGSNSGLNGRGNMSSRRVRSGSVI